MERPREKGGCMSDFYQTGVISTLHRFPNGDKLEKMEADLKKFSR